MKIFSILVISMQLVLAQSLVPSLYKVSSSNFDSSAYRGLKSNMISDIIPQEDTLLWLGTGSGLAVLRDKSNIYTLSGDSLLGKGGVVALASDKKKLFAAFAKSGENITIGNGLIYSEDATGTLINWTYFEQPVEKDSIDSLATFVGKYFYGLPITAKEANVTYDAAISGNYIWITSWAGGLRRYDISRKTWERIPLPQDGDRSLNTCEQGNYKDTAIGDVLKNFYLNPRDPWDGSSAKSLNQRAYGNHNHKAFSVIAYDNIVWVGTANGINKGIIGNSGCIDWTHYTPTDGLTGGFVVDLERQVTQGKSIIWGATVTAGQGEKSGLSYSTDNGETWYSTLINERVYNIATEDTIILVASKTGLWKTVTDDPLDLAKTWAKYKPAKQSIQIGSTDTYRMDEILSDEVVGVSYDMRPYFSSTATIWMGSWDGLARTLDSKGNNWQIYRTNYDTKKVYAYPNPFSPYEHNQLGGDGYVHIHATVKTSFVVYMDVYNFAMEPVLETQFDRRQANTGSLKWNGKDKNGRLVDNGTYFIRLEFDQKIEWIKLIVIK